MTTEERLLRALLVEAQATRELVQRCARLLGMIAKEVEPPSSRPVSFRLTLEDSPER